MPAPSSAARWREVGLDRLTSRLESLDTSDGVRRRTRWSAADLDAALLVDEHWTADGDAVVLRADLAPTGRWDLVWPRLGLTFELPARSAEPSGSAPVRSSRTPTASAPPAWVGSRRRSTR
ncbi:hypothetical protein B0T42_16010 [Rathayibacter sp. VKM Ac-2630]|nr:hypothetical protein B0T42_16010 [Rathayibacter sp. VKM Ac-2630]